MISAAIPLGFCLEKRSDLERPLFFFSLTAYDFSPHRTSSIVCRLTYEYEDLEGKPNMTNIQVPHTLSSDVSTRTTNWTQLHTPNNLWYSPYRPFYNSTFPPLPLLMICKVLTPSHSHSLLSLRITVLHFFREAVNNFFVTSKFWIFGSRGKNVEVHLTFNLNTNTIFF